MNLSPGVKPIAIIGSGPAGLMAASVISSRGYPVQVYEKKSGLGRKILIAGSSGLNVGFDCTFQELVGNYQGPPEQWETLLKGFSPHNWLDFIHSLGLETFLGTSGRYFVKGMKGSNLLKNWVDVLKSRGVEFFLNYECVAFEFQNGNLALTMNLKTGKQEIKEFSMACFCLGGGSWERAEKPLRWPSLFMSKGLKFKEFVSANCGFRVDWTAAFLKEAEGLPLKGIVFHSKRGSRAGELVITQYGIEGTPIYAVGEIGETWLDLKPSLSDKELLKKLNSSQENLSPMRRVKKHLNLSPAALALIYHFSTREELSNLNALAKKVKKFPLVLKERQPLEEAISSSGGLSWDEVGEFLMLKKFPGVFVAGEMLDWDAPTGGFLIQGCVSQGYYAAQGVLKLLECGSLRAWNVSDSQFR